MKRKNNKKKFKRSILVRIKFIPLRFARVTTGVLISFLLTFTFNTLKKKVALTQRVYYFLLSILSFGGKKTYFCPCINIDRHLALHLIPFNMLILVLFLNFSCINEVVLVCPTCFSFS